MLSNHPHISTGSYAALQYHSTSNEVRPPIISGAMPSTHMGRNPYSISLPRAENPEFKVLGGLSGAPYVLQVQGNFHNFSPIRNSKRWKAYMFY